MSPSTQGYRPKLDKNRATDATDGKGVVVAHNELEKALTKIFGIPNDQAISEAVFSVVRSDGGITQLTFSNGEQKTTVEGSTGIDFYDGNLHKRLTFANSQIAIWAYDEDTEEWTQTFDYEAVVEPNLVDMTDVHMPILSASQVVVVGLVEGELKFVLADAQVPEDGVTSFRECSDVADGLFTGQYTGNQFDPAKYGHYVGIHKEANHLVPIEPDVGQDYFITMRSYAQDLKRIGQKGQGATGDWTIVTWDSGLREDGTAVDKTEDLRSYGSYSNAAFALAAGVYDVDIGYSLNTSRAANVIIWKLIGYGFHQFPDHHMVHQVPFSYNQSPAFPFDDVFLVEEGENEISGNQKVQVLVPTTANLTLLMGRESVDPCSAVATVSIARIL
jgi:hypothetical protein